MGSGTPGLIFGKYGNHAIGIIVCLIGSNPPVFGELSPQSTDTRIPGIHSAIRFNFCGAIVGQIDILIKKGSQHFC